MTICSKSKIFKPKVLTTKVFGGNLLPKPKCYKKIKGSVELEKAMKVKYDAFLKNNT